MQPVDALRLQLALVVGNVKQPVHGRGAALRVPERRKPHNLGGIILSEAEILRHPLPQHADGMGIGDLLDHFQSAGPPFPSQVVADSAIPSTTSTAAEGSPAAWKAGRMRDMMRNEVEARSHRATPGLADDLRDPANAPIESPFSPFGSKADRLADRIRIAPNHRQALAGHEGVGHGVKIGELLAVCGPQAIADGKPGQLIGVGDAGGLGVFFARIAFFLGREKDLAATDNCGCALVVGGIQAEHQRQFSRTALTHPSTLDVRAGRFIPPS